MNIKVLMVLFFCLIHNAQLENWIEIEKCESGNLKDVEVDVIIYLTICYYVIWIILGLIILHLCFVILINFVRLRTELLL